MNKKIQICFALCLTSVCLFASCNSTKNSESNIKNTNSKVFLKYNKSGVAKKNKKLTFNKSDKLPLLTKDGYVGYLKFNQITKVNAWDLCNQKAVNNGVKYSYSFNLHLKYLSNIKGSTDLICKIYLKDKKGVTIGSPCSVGWTGFPEKASLFSEKKRIDFEIGMQPEVKKIPKGSYLVLNIIDNQNNKYEEITLSKRILKHIKTEGVTLELKDSKTVNFINGAKVRYRINKCYYEKHNTDFDTSNQQPYYDFEYDVYYQKAPTSKREVTMFDSNNSKKLNPFSVIAVTSNLDTTKLYESDQHALRLKNSSSFEEEHYVTIVRDKLKVGYGVKLSANRKLPKTTPVKPNYLRFTFEFPEEGKARNTREMLRFNGRFLNVLAKPAIRKLNN